jgi:hypothetical protein
MYNRGFNILIASGFFTLVPCIHLQAEDPEEHWKHLGDGRKSREHIPQGVGRRRSMLKALLKRYLFHIR